MSIKRSYSIILVLILLFSVLARIVMHFIFPDMLIAFDAWTHLRISEGIVSDAYISPSTGYTQFPGLHITTVLASLISNIPLMHIYKFIVPSVTTILLILSVYLFTQKIFGNVKYSFLSALLAGTCDSLILQLMFSIPESIGLALFALLIYVLMRFEGYSRYGLVGFILASLSYIHHLSFFISLVISCSFFVFVTVREHKEFMNTGLFVLFSLFLLYIRFFETLVGMWLLGYLHLPSISIVLLLILFTVAIISFIQKSYLQTILSRYVSLLKTIFGNRKIIVLLSLFIFGVYVAFDYYLSPTLTEFYRETFASLNKILIFEFGLLGIYFLCNEEKVSKNSMKYIFLLSFIILIFGCSFYLLKDPALFYLPFRIMSFVFIVIMPLTSLGIIKLYKKSIKMKNIFLALIFLIVLLSSFYNCCIWHDEKYSVYPTYQEYASVKYMDSNLHHNNTVLTDNCISRFTNKFRFEWINKNKIKKLQSKEDINNQIRYIVIKNRLTPYLGKAHCLNETVITSSGIDRIYNNADVTVYRKT